MLGMRFAAFVIAAATPAFAKPYDDAELMLQMCFVAGEVAASSRWAFAHR